MSTRREQLNDIISFIDKSQNDLNNILEEIGWTEEDTLKQFNNNQNPESATIKENKSDPLYPQSYPWRHTVAIDTDSLNQILKTTGKRIPEKFSDSQTNFNRDQKLRLYEYAIEKTGKLSEPEVSVIFNQDEGSKKEMTFAEIVAFKRDLKRRRLKYRTTKAPPLSHTEEIRNLIELQMQALNQYLQPEKQKRCENCSDIDKNEPGTSKISTHHFRESAYTSGRKRSKSRSAERKSHKKNKRTHRSKSRDRKNLSKEHSSHNRKKSGKKHKKRSRSKDK